MANQEKVIQLLETSTDQLYWHLLDYCDKLLEEQRRLNVQIKLSKACQEFRSTRTKYDRDSYIDFKKSDLEVFYNKIKQIPFIQTETVFNFKKDLELSINNFNLYYDEDTGIRKHNNTK